jgi:hypothetical protein
MILRQTTMNACLAVAMSLGCATLAQAQAGAESFTATATVKTAGGAEATAPVTITIDRKMPEAESDKLVAAFKSGGPVALRNALAGAPPTGSVQLADGAPTQPSSPSSVQRTPGGWSLSSPTRRCCSWVRAFRVRSSKKAMTLR